MRRTWPSWESGWGYSLMQLSQVPWLMPCDQSDFFFCFIALVVMQLSALLCVHFKEQIRINHIAVGRKIVSKPFHVKISSISGTTNIKYKGWWWAFAPGLRSNCREQMWMGRVRWGYLSSHFVLEIIEMPLIALNYFIEVLKQKETRVYGCTKYLAVRSYDLNLMPETLIFLLKMPAGFYFYYFSKSWQFVKLTVSDCLAKLFKGMY